MAAHGPAGVTSSSGPSNENHSSQQQPMSLPPATTNQYSTTPDPHQPLSLPHYHTTTPHDEAATLPNLVQAMTLKTSPRNLSSPEIDNSLICNHDNNSNIFINNNSLKYNQNNTSESQDSLYVPYDPTNSTCQNITSEAPSPDLSNNSKNSSNNNNNSSSSFLYQDVATSSEWSELENIPRPPMLHLPPDDQWDVYVSHITEDNKVCFRLLGPDYNVSYATLSHYVPGF